LNFCCPFSEFFGEQYGNLKERKHHNNIWGINLNSKRNFKSGYTEKRRGETERAGILNVLRVPNEKETLREGKKGNNRW
jgi:hypothetical protein